LDDTIKASKLLTKERYARRQKRLAKRVYCGTPEGVEVTAKVFLDPLTKFLAGEDPNNPPPPCPPELFERLDRIPNSAPHVALAILAPVLDAIARGWEPKKADTKPIRKKDGTTVKPADNWKTLLAKQMGETLCHWLALKETEMAKAEREAERARRYKERTGKRLILRKARGPKPRYKFRHYDWTSSECTVAGGWMIEVVRRLSCFDIDPDNGRLRIAPEWQEHVDKICDDLLLHHPVMLPHREPPKPTTGWWTHHGERLRTPWVRDWRPETRQLHEAKFASGSFPHADGVNVLKRVPLRINQTLLPLVDKFAAELMGHDGKQLVADRKTIKADLRHARWVCNGNGAVYLDYGCDRRGRVYSEQQLNYAREDHVRAMFEFERDEPLGDDGLSWLEIHLANCEGSTEKETWSERQLWVKKHTDRILEIAADPEGTFDLCGSLPGWRDADKPFAFVAACIEFSRGRKDPQGFMTRLPIGFDGTCNGIQHLAMLSRDEKAGRLVNLIDTDAPKDIYKVVTNYIMQMLEDEDPRPRSDNKKINDAWCYEWWRERLSGLSDKNKRKLFKNPTMTFPYSATPEGRGDAIVDVYKELFKHNKLTEPLDQARNFLAKAVRVACEDKLKGPVRIMRYVRELALHRLRQGKFLEMRSATGFPFINMYHEPNVIDIDLDSFGLRSTVADGALPETRDVKILNAASPNFIHFLDATHLMLTVLAANKEGIDILPVHDSYSCLAPRAARLGRIIRAQMAMLHAVDPLRTLRDANVDDPNLYPLPERGNLDPLDVQNAEYAFM
jgi:hypothetical protein